MPHPENRKSEGALASAEGLYRQGRFPDALRVLASQPQSLEGSLLKGACLARLMRGLEAVEVFEDVLERDPDCFDALTWMAVLKKNPREIQQALQYAQRAVALRPDDAIGYGAMGSCFLYLRDSQQAIESFHQAIALSPDTAEHHHNLAAALLMDQRHGEAIQHLKKAIELAPQSPQSYLALAGAYMLFGIAGEALACLEQGLSHSPNSAALHSSAAKAFAMIRNDSAAERHHRRALELSPATRGDFATWLLNQGRFAEANESFQLLIDSRGDPAMGYYGLMQSRKLNSEDRPFVKEMQDFLVAGNLRPGCEMRVRYALGRAEEQLKGYEEAMSHFNAANSLAYAIHHAGHPVDPNGFQREHAQIRALFEALDETPSSDGPSDSPIFIIGMIRSGTTLLDQIVSSHPEVASGGELRFWIEETLRLVAQSKGPTPNELSDLAESYLRYTRLLVKDGLRLTDKMPLNFAYSGVILRALPNARFLHIQRNPVDTCLSIYTTYFGKGALFAYNKRNIVAYYRAYLQAMEYWRKTLPEDRLLEVQYEDLVSHPEEVIPKVIEFCGLPWNEACLRHEQNVSAINTPSRWQARQPVYKTSAGRWKNYEPWLGEFSELLSP